MSTIEDEARAAAEVIQIDYEAAFGDSASVAVRRSAFVQGYLAASRREPSESCVRSSTAGSGATASASTSTLTSAPTRAALDVSAAARLARGRWSPMARKRKLATLSRDDIGKRVAFTCTCCGHHVEGTLRAFTHGVFSHPSAGEVDVPRVGIMVYAYRNTHAHHWALPETLAMLTEQEGQSDGEYEELTRIADRLEGDIFDAVPDDNRQGQITDAMLLAAMNAKYPDAMPAPDLSYFGTASKDSMRDSLRAALEAAEEARRG